LPTRLWNFPEGTRQDVGPASRPIPIFRRTGVRGAGWRMDWRQKTPDHTRECFYLHYSKQDTPDGGRECDIYIEYLPSPPTQCTLSSAYISPPLSDVCDPVHAINQSGLWAPFSGHSDCIHIA
jgi:hypothetical protein